MRDFKKGVCGIEREHLSECLNFHDIVCFNDQAGTSKMKGFQMYVILLQMEFTKLRDLIRNGRELFFSLYSGESS